MIETERSPMTVRDIMSKNVACCAPETSLKEVARMMVENDCGEIPVVDVTGRPLGVVTDRDITCRAVAQGRNPLTLQAADCMSTPCIAVTPETSLEACCATMERNRIRRVPVVDESRVCCGMVAQADVARRGPGVEAIDVLRGVSQPSDAASQIPGGH
jgi:CBS domain-containing protein